MAQVLAPLKHRSFISLGFKQFSGSAPMVLGCSGVQAVAVRGNCVVMCHVQQRQQKGGDPCLQILFVEKLRPDRSRFILLFSLLG